MKVPCLLIAVLIFTLNGFAAERVLKIDESRSFVDVDVDAALNFTAHLDAYEARVSLDDAGKIRGALFKFKFADLKTGNAERDGKMIEWLGGGVPECRFELGNLAVTPDGQGQASGRLILNGVTERIEFPIEITQADGSYTITGDTTIDCRTWNLKVIRTAMFLKVNPNVKVRFKLTGVPVVGEAR